MDTERKLFRSRRLGQQKKWHSRLSKHFLSFKCDSLDCKQAMSRFVLGAIIGATGYLLLRRPRDDILVYDFTPPPSMRSPPGPTVAAVLNASSGQVPLSSEAEREQPSAAAVVLRAVMWNIFAFVLIVLGIAQYNGAERSHTVGIGVAGVLAVLLTWIVLQSQVQVQRSPAPLSQTFSAILHLCLGPLRHPPSRN